MKSRNLLIAYAIKYKGDWEKIYQDILNKVEPSEEELLQAENVNAITILDEEYPERLKNIVKPPFVLFYKGNTHLLNDTEALAVVGSRNPKGGTITFTERFVKSRNETIISGLTVGINSKVAFTALNNDKNIILVSAQGIDNSSTFPELYKKVAQKGLIISEYPFDSEPEMNNFPMRNRIIAGLCKAVCVMDITQASGTNIIVSYALHNGKEIFVKPEIEKKESYANKMIDEGCVCLTLSTNI